MQVQVEQLPESCLLTLHLDGADSRSLVLALRQVLRAAPTSIWVDCRYVAELPAEAMRLLRWCAASLWRRGGYVVMCYLPTTARAELGGNAAQPLAASLLDAQRYGLDCPTSSLAAPESAR